MGIFLLPLPCSSRTSIVSYDNYRLKPSTLCKLLINVRAAFPGGTVFKSSLRLRLAWPSAASSFRPWPRHAKPTRLLLTPANCAPAPRSAWTPQSCSNPGPIGLVGPAARINSTSARRNTAHSWPASANASPSSYTKKPSPLTMKLGWRPSSKRSASVSPTGCWSSSST